MKTESVSTANFTKVAWLGNAEETSAVNFMVCSPVVKGM